MIYSLFFYHVHFTFHYFWWEVPLSSFINKCKDDKGMLALCTFNPASRTPSLFNWKVQNVFPNCSSKGTLVLEQLFVSWTTFVYCLCSAFSSEFLKTRFRVFRVLNPRCKPYAGQTTVTSGFFREKCQLTCGFLRTDLEQVRKLLPSGAWGQPCSAVTEARRWLGMAFCVDTLTYALFCHRECPPRTGWLQPSASFFTLWIKPQVDGAEWSVQPIRSSVSAATRKSCGQIRDHRLRRRTFGSGDVFRIWLILFHVSVYFVHVLI